MKTKPNKKVKYALNSKGCFVIENYNKAKPFSNFFPGIAGVWGIPMWVFFVNRGQCVASFGIEAKDKAIMEFQPANKSYRLTSLQGFRTFIKIKSGKNNWYWEPFQCHLPGTHYRSAQKLSMTAHDLTIEEKNEDLGLVAEVNYFTMPEEPYSALVRQLTIKNESKKDYSIEVIDGLPVVLPYGLTDSLNKNLSRTVEAWVKVHNVENKAPFYHLNVEVSDKPEVAHIREGNFYFCFENNPDKIKLLDPLVEASNVFGQSHDFTSPEAFLNGTFTYPVLQQTANRSVSAMAFGTFELTPKAHKQIVSLMGNTHNLSNLKDIVDQATGKGFIKSKAQRNKIIIDEIKNIAFTKTSSEQFNLYSAQTFLDNILRGGLPVSLHTSDGNVAFNVFSRKHGDLERDYNYFVVAPTYYSQGNGNYRDVNQNRRNDVWFNGDVKDNNLVNFLNLIQADGYNPLIVRGTSFRIDDENILSEILDDYFDQENKLIIEQYLKQSFLPGDLLLFIMQNDIVVQGDPKAFLGRILDICHKQELADHGEGYWTDHWTYNLDLIESFLAIYPEELKSLLLERTDFTFFKNAHYVLPREHRYILTDRGVRQYQSVCEESIEGEDHVNQLRSKNGEGAVYSTTLICKLLCLLANKVASLDPSGIGVEMEADKPNWYDALNGLPGLLGSAISETVEIKRFSLFLLEALKKLGVSDTHEIDIFEELATLIYGLTNLLSLDESPESYWNKSNDIKEHYRQRIRDGIEGNEKSLTIKEVKTFLELIIRKTDKAIDAAKDKEGFLTTYFYHDVTQYDMLDKSHNELNCYVKPTSFQRHNLPAFLEGYVHALRVESDKNSAKGLYQKVRESDLYDKPLKMYKVNSSIESETEEIGRTRIFPSGWLENESIWLHMEYKFMLELIRCELFEEFYDNFKHVLVPFLKPEKYGRSILENSSFIVSSAHEDQSLHGQGFVARLSGSTAEFMHIWLLMNVGKNPFSLDAKGNLILQFKPALPGWLFTKQKSKVKFMDKGYTWQDIELPPNTYSFNFLGSTLVVYHNPKRRDTFGPKKTTVKEIHLTYPNRKRAELIKTEAIPSAHAAAIRNREVCRIDVFFK